MKYIIVLLCLFSVIPLTDQASKSKPTLYIIGDSTVKNGRGDGAGGLWGWGDLITQFTDSTRINVENHALGGTSSRTFLARGLWEQVSNKLKKGDYVLMQFGHNDSSPVNDTLRARGTLPGTGDESQEIDNLITKKHETVHTYGWYLHKFIQDAKAKGAVPVVLSPVPRDSWKDGKVQLVSETYGKWAAETATRTGTFFVDLNGRVAARYEELGPGKVSLLFPADHTHTNLAGALLNARAVAEGIRALKKCKLSLYIDPAKEVHLPSVQHKTEYPVTRFGAVNDDKTLNTKSIQAAIDQCAAGGGGIVVIPKGIFLTGAVFLKQGVDLRVDKGGIIKGTTNLADYPPVATRWEGEEREWTSALVNAFDMSHFTISGEGMIDGSGEKWLDQRRTIRRDSLPGRNLYGSPRLIALQRCHDAKVSGLNLKNQACWCLFILYSEKIEVNDLIIRAEHNIPMSDGMDIDSSDGIHISGCDIDVNDDCIAIKSGKDEDGRRVNRPCENVLVEKCIFRYGHGGVSMGSEMSGGIRNIVIQNCTMEADNWAPIRFKCQPSRGGVVENITYRDIILKNTLKAFEFNMEWRMVNPKPASDPLPVFRHVKIINVSGTVGKVGDMHGLKGSPIRNVVFENCHISAKTGFVLDNVEDLDLSGLTIEVQRGEPVIWKK